MRPLWRDLILKVWAATHSSVLAAKAPCNLSAKSSTARKSNSSSASTVFGRASSNLLVHRRRPLISKPWSLSSRPGRRLKSGSPMTNPTSIGSTVLGVPPIPTQTASINARHGAPRKSPLMMAASWFSNTPEKGEQASRLFLSQPLPKEILAKRFGKLRSRQMEIAVKSSRFHQNPASCGVFSLSAFQFSAFQLYPSSPFPPQPPFPRPPV